MPRDIRQVKPNPVCRPRRHAATEEVGVFGPNRAVEGERRGEDGPIVFVASGNSLTGEIFKEAVGFDLDSLHQPGYELRESRYSRRAPAWSASLHPPFAA
jgi:hypothetical protein